MITIYTDGSFNIQQSIGGWAAIVLDDGVEKEYSGNSEDANGLSHIGRDEATSQRMEIIAVLEGLLTLTTPSNVEIISDSKYVVDTMNKGWLERWIKENKSNKKHLDLWKIIYTLSKIHNVKFTWVKGHAGDYYNEKCDSLAQRETQKLITLNELANSTLTSKEQKERSTDNDVCYEERVKSVNELVEIGFLEEKAPFDELEIANKEKQNVDKLQNESVKEISSERTKRKKSTNKKKEFFYAVAKGRKIGVFKSWNECNKNVNRYKGAIFKKFDSEEEALDFIEMNK